MKNMKWMLIALGMAVAGCKGGENSVALLKSQEWQLKTMTVSGETVANPQELPELAFSDSTRMAGSAGCNRFFGTYVTGEKGEITLTPGGTTMMYCPDMQFEDRYLKALPTVKSYTVTEEQLTLKDAEGQLELVYVPLKKKAE